jgi:fused signal recognition particle receptor
MSLFNSINKKDEELNKTSDKIQKGILSIFAGKKLDNETVEKLEDLLITSDISIDIVNNITNFIQNNRYSKDIEIDDVKRIIFERLYSMVKCGERNFTFLQKPYVMLFVGVNGSGKTTVIGKIAHKLKMDGKKALLAACDTFRAGATEQLDLWAKRAGADLIKKQRDNEDPASLACRAYTQARDEKYDFLLVDTAGRLQNNINLMEELGKINRVLKKMDANAPQQSILVLDAGIGQNSLKQFEGFRKIVNIDSFVMNKLDSTARGGILISLINQFKKPVFAVGVGEKIDDIKDFDATEFLNNLLGL